MAAITRRGNLAKIPAGTTLADADDLDGTTDNTQILDVTGSLRVIYWQINNGTAGTAGVDVIEVSTDGGTTWSVDNTLLAIASNDLTGTHLAGVLNAAGVEPPNGALFKGGPYEGPTKVRVGRKTTTTNGTTWITGAPTVIAYAIGT